MMKVELVYTKRNTPFRLIGVETGSTNAWAVNFQFISVAVGSFPLDVIIIVIKASIIYSIWNTKMVLKWHDNPF